MSLAEKATILRQQADPPSNARIRAMARMIAQAVQEDEEWSREILRSTPGLPREVRRRLQAEIQRTVDVEWKIRPG